MLLKLAKLKTQIPADHYYHTIVSILQLQLLTFVVLVLSCFDTLQPNDISYFKKILETRCSKKSFG